MNPRFLLVIARWRNMAREDVKFLSPRSAHTIAQLVNIRKFLLPYMNFTLPALHKEDLQQLGPIVLVGHRGSGKSTLGRLLADSLSLQFFDLDHELERTQSTPIDEQLRAPRAFRAREVQLLRQLSTSHPTSVIACGAGVEALPQEAFVVWIDREDWRQEVQKSARPRVRPDLSLEQEWTWMEETRQPRWLDAAHLRLPIPRGRSVEQSAQELTTLLRWTLAAKHSPLATRTFFVPLKPADLLRAQLDAHRLGLGGVELRSDIFDDRPPALQTPFIASLRTPDPTWLQNFEDARAWDIDLQFLSALPQSTPAHLILSTHPQKVDEADLDRLFNAAEDLPDRSLTLKYAPKVRSWAELDRFLKLVERLRSSRFAFTALPQGSFAWLRPIFALQNKTNYLPLGLRRRDKSHPSALDLQDSLPHLAGPSPTGFDALIGDPVKQSQGDLWHRRQALETAGEEDLSYLKIPVKAGELDQALSVLSKLPIRGISVTSPLKREAAQSPFIRAALPAINTLKRGAPWTGTDTDAAGMSAVLNDLEAQGVGPGRALIIGQGGVSPALRRALKERGWELVAHLSARKGFTQEHRSLTDLALIINAGGPQAGRSPQAPPCQVWLDLNYSDVHPAPTGTTHLQGDLFFDAQARAQRLFWKDD